MNLKYYLRGLGVGIVVTALILGIGLGSRKETLSNEEIKERARALGMVEESITVAEAARQDEEKQPETEKEPAAAESPDQAQNETLMESPEPMPSTALTASPEPSTGQEPTMSPSPEADTTAAAAPSATPSAEAELDEDNQSKEETTAVLPKETPDNTDNTSGEIVDITVNPGEGSMAISRKLEESGLIDDAAEYDAYLCDNGYHTKLRAGTHRIPMGSTREEIAKLLCQ